MNRNGRKVYVKSGRGRKKHHPSISFETENTVQVQVYLGQSSANLLIKESKVQGLDRDLTLSLYVISSMLPM
jgi:hypothetical protein